MSLCGQTKSIASSVSQTGAVLGAVGLSAIALLGVPKSAEAFVIVPLPDLPPVCGSVMECGYINSSQLHALYEVNPQLAIELSEINHTGFDVNFVIDDGPDEIENFDSILWGVVTVNGQETEIDLPGTVETRVFGKAGQTTGSFGTQISFLHQGRIGDLDVMIRSSETLTSGGATTIEALSTGEFQIDSFFNVFTEVSVDGGQTWIADSANPTGVFVELEDTEPHKIPEPATAIASILVGLGGLLGLKKKQLS